MNINFNNLLKISIPFSILLVLSYFISILVFYNLPKTGVDFVSNEKSILKYTNYKLGILFTDVIKEKTPIQKNLKKGYQLLSSLSLNAIYAKMDGSGWVIIKENSSLKTHIIEQGKSFKNYKLKFLFPRYIIFEKNNKEYKLTLKESDKKFEIDRSNKRNSSEIEKIILDGDNVVIKRKILNTYVNNIDKVWNNIKIDEVKTNGFISGFKVSKIAKGSLFEKLGLKRDDILTNVNNITLNNYNSAFKIYKDIKNLKNLNIKLLRNNRQMEINYEIN